MDHKARIKKLALSSLAANLVETKQGSFFVAGANQFKSLWVRDFCYSVPGLLKAGFADVVERQLNLIAQNQRDDFLIPRGLDVVNPKLRVVWNSLLRPIPFPFSYLSTTMVPEFLGEHGTPAFDSNLLFLLAKWELANFKGTKSELTTDEVTSYLKFYQANDQGLIPQPAFSDWQDSVRREGPLLLTQILHLAVLIKYPFSQGKVEAARNSIMQNYFDFNSGLFFEDLNRKQVSLDSHWYLLTHPEIFPQLSHHETYQSLKRHNLWTSKIIPGVPVFPEHNSSDVSWTTKVVGLRHYHDGFHWGWLIAAAYQLTVYFGDTTESERLIGIFAQAHPDDSPLGEIYELGETQFKLARRTFYRSESPFTWTSAIWLAAI